MQLLRVASSQGGIMTGSTEQIETVVIGGGHAGLTMSYYLSQCGREHLILERGRVAERWRSERWASFCFQFPNWTLELPGYTYQGENPKSSHLAVRL